MRHRLAGLQIADPASRLEALGFALTDDAIDLGGVRLQLGAASGPGIVAWAVFAFLTSFDDVVLAIFLTNVRSRTLPKLMYEGVAHEINPTITAVAAMLVLLTAVVLALDMALQRRRV